MKKILIVIAVYLLSGCDARSEIAALESFSDPNKEWVFAQFNVDEENDVLDSYFYYGRVSASLLEKIKHNKIDTGFILLENVRYWGDKDLVYDFKDSEHTGDLVFRIEDIVRIQMVHTPPVVGLGYEQYEDQMSESEELGDEVQSENSL